MSAIYENLRQLITVVDELRDVGLQKYISLPRIAAIGTQSSGKSSLIESIVGLDFLPRGGGVVTRRPLELRLVHLNTQEFQGDQAWAVFDKVSDRKFTDFDQVREEIERQTDQVAGSNKGIVNDPIVLTIYATGAPDLTLIDLPGITRVPIKGSDQSEDIEKLTRDMTLHYIRDPRTIILAVLPANQDMSVSDALQLARQVDPQGLRSIGVITKIDIMDQGTDACKMLMGEDVPLRLGYVGVKMRSQQDITSRKAVKDALADEKAWFDQHRVYGKLPPGLVGTPVLIDKLTQILFRHIRRFLPEIKTEINEKRRGVEDRLAELGEGIPLDEAERVQLMWTMVTDYCEMFKNTIRGKFDRKLQRYMANLPGGGDAGGGMSGGARVRSIMNEFLSDFSDVNMTSEMSDEDIDRAIRMHEGDSLPGFPSPDTFEFLALPHLQKIAIPSVECVHSVASALDVLAQRIAQAVFRRFPKLAEIALEMTQNIIQQQKDATRIIVEQQVASYTGYLFTNDPTYLTEHGSMEPMYPGKAPKPAPPQEEEKPPGAAEKTLQSVKDGSRAAIQGVSNLFSGAEKRKQQRYSGPFVQEIRRRLDSYLAITVRNARDSIPKAVGFYLVRAVQDKLQFELLTALNQKDRISELLGEPPHIREERKALTNLLSILQRASTVLTRDPTLMAIAFDTEIEEVTPPARQSQPADAAPGAAAVPQRVAATPAPATAAPQPQPAVRPVAAVPGTAAAAQRPSATATTAPSLFGAPPPTKAGLFDDGPVTGPVAKKAASKNPLFD